MKLIKAFLKYRLGLKENIDSMEISEAINVLKDLQKTSENVPKEHGGKDVKTYLEGAILECLQFDIRIDFNVDDENPLVYIDENIAENVVNSIAESISLYEAIYTGFMPVSRDSETNKYIYQNEDGEQRFFSPFVYDLCRKKDTAESFDKLFQTIRQSKNVACLELRDHSNTLRSKINANVIPDATVKPPLVDQSNEIFYTSHKTKVNFLKVPLTGKSNVNWEVSFVPNPPENFDSDILEKQKYELLISDPEFHQLIKDKEVYFQHDDVRICDINIHLEQKDGDFFWSIKKATITKVYV